MKSLNLPLTRPYFQGEELQTLSDVLDSEWLTQGSYVTDFEDSVAQYVGVKHAVACTSCTTALHVGLLLQGVGAGDEVIIPSYTWIATANVVRMVGAIPVFVDIDLSTFNIAPELIEVAITPCTKAIIPVHQFGLPADMDRVNEIALRHGLAVVEDAACAIGSQYEGKAIGSLGNLTCFSFHPRKVITTGEGGMLLTDDSDISQQARVLINHGGSVSGIIKHKAGTVEALLAEEFREVGYNFRMTNLQGALGVVQMKALDDILFERRKRAELYNEEFSKIPCIITPKVPAYAQHNWQTYAIRIDADSPITRDSLAQHLLDAGISCRPAYMACHVQPLYRSIYPDMILPNTEKALKEVLILPLYPRMSAGEQEYVTETIYGLIYKS